MQWYPVFVFLLGCPSFLSGLPADVSTDPAAAAAPEPAPPAPAPNPAAEQAAPAPPAEAAPPAPVAPQPTSPAVAPPQGSGSITEHKNPDGSTVTITRFNGPIPASAFKSPLGADLTGLHDSLSSNLYQTQLFQLQAQQALVNQALLRNYYQYPLAYYRTPSYFPYVYSGPFLSPFFGYGYPFYPGYGPQQSVLKSG